MKKIDFWTTITIKLQQLRSQDNCNF